MNILLPDNKNCFGKYLSVSLYTIVRECRIKQWITIFRQMFIIISISELPNHKSSSKSNKICITKLSKLHCGFINICWVPVFFNFIVELIEIINGNWSAFFFQITLLKYRLDHYPSNFVSATLCYFNFI